jgi:hypothetical protein
MEIFKPSRYDKNNLMKKLQKERRKKIKLFFLQRITFCRQK